MGGPLSYNRAINKILMLFHSIENRRQIPMAEKYANMLIRKTVQSCGGGYWVKETMQGLLSGVVENNVYRLLEDEKV